MGYPNTWKDDRRGRRAVGFQARRERIGTRLPGARRSRLGPLRRLALPAARGISRLHPVLGLGFLAIELGWYYYQSQQSGNPHGWSGPYGWAYGGPCPGFNRTTFKQAHFQGILHCFLGTVPGVPLGTPIPDNHTSFHLGYRFGSKIKDREWWWRSPGTFPGSVPIAPGNTPVPIAPSPISPGTPFDPMDIPLTPSPTVHPDPLPLGPRPMRKRRDWSSPGEGREEGPPREARKRPREDRPRYRDPNQEITVRPRPGPATSAPGNPVRRPPKRVRERKLRTRSAQAFNLIRRVFEAAFEAVDIIDAIYEALPRNVRDWYGITRRDPVDRMWVIHRHWQTISLEEMVVNLVANEVEDYIYGRLGRVSQNVAQNLFLSTGPQFGSGARRSEVQAWRRRRRKELEETIAFLRSEMETFK